MDMTKDLILRDFFDGTDGLAVFCEALQNGRNGNLQSAMEDAIASVIGYGSGDESNWLYYTAEYALGGAYENIAEIQKEYDEATAEEEELRREEEEEKEAYYREAVGEE